MRRLAIWTLAILIPALLSLAALAAGTGDSKKTTKEELDCALYTKPYEGNEHGAFLLPAGLEWRVMPQYVGVRDGERVIDDRITLVLVDEDNRFWPFIAKMSVEQAAGLQKQLSTVIDEKLRGEPAP